MRISAITVTLTIAAAIMAMNSCNQPVTGTTLQINVEPIPTEVDTNVPKISGKVSDPQSIVYINNSRALVLDDGSFFRYVEVSPRVPATIEIRAEAAGQTVSESFVTTFYPNPFVWVLDVDTGVDPARMEGWVSYPDAHIEITGNVKDPAVEVQANGFFTATFTLSQGYTYPGSDEMRYDIAVRVNTSRGWADGAKINGVTMDSPLNPMLMLNDVPVYTRKVYAERGKTVLVDREYYYNVSSPTMINLELVPDHKKGVIPENLSVGIEPKSFLGYPDYFGAPRHSTILIKVGEDVPPGSYLFRANRGDHIEVVVE